MDPRKVCRDMEWLTPKKVKAVQSFLGLVNFYWKLICDVSNFTAGAVLSQAQADGMHQPIAFMSKGFSDVECNYQIHDKEMLAIMHTLDEWCHFLEGTMEKFEILMDHQNLAYF